MGTKLSARVLHTLARQDCFEGVGRIFLSEARQNTGKELMATDILELWAEYYPAETAEEKQFNLILIHFDGKPKLKRKKPIGTLTAGCSTVTFPADTTNLFTTEKEPYDDGTIINEPDEQNIIW